MPTTLDQSYPYASGAGGVVSEDQWRRMEGNAPTGRLGVVRGVLSEFHVAQRGAGANMSVDVAPGECRILGTAGYDDDTTSIAIASNGTGNPRIDRIVVRNDLVNRRIELDVLQGTAAVSPSAPALTQNVTTAWEESLAQVAVASGAVSITDSNITDERRWANAQRWFLKWAIAGSIVVPSGASGYIIEEPFELEDGWSAVISRAFGWIRAGTSVTYKIRKATSYAGSLADVTGLTSLSATTTRAKTDLATTAEVAIVDGSILVPVVTAVSASPDNLAVGVAGWKWPTPQVA